MDTSRLEQFLRDFGRVATLVRDGQHRQVWRFTFDDRGYFLHFHPRAGARLGPAMMHFTRLQSLQRASVPSPRAVAHLSGFRVNQVLGDAVITEEIPGAIALPETLENLSPTQHYDVARQVVQIVHGIGAAKFGDRELSIGRFLYANGKVHFHDVSGLRSGGMRLNDIHSLAHSAAGLATIGDLVHGWNVLNPDAPLPNRNPISPKRWRRQVRRTQQENDDYGILRAGDWSGYFTRQSSLPCPWSLASRLTIATRDWEIAWPSLLAQIESGQLTIIKSDPSGEVLAGQVVVAGRPIDIFVKRPGRKFRYRYLTDLFRPSRARRSWQKAWMLLVREIPCEWPMLVMERRVIGYAMDSLIVFERVPGMRLDKIDLNSLESSRREMLFRRAGRILRRMEQTNLAHTDAKSTNWIVFDDPRRGPSPILIDPYGVRPLTYFLSAFGIHRLLRAMQNHPQYTPSDSLALCRGYAPFARSFKQERPEREP